jgi:hypothetical protein
MKQLFQYHDGIVAADYANVLNSVLLRAKYTCNTALPIAKGTEY